MHLDEFEDVDWVNSTRVKHISFEFNRLTAPTATDDLKVGVIFQSKVELMQAINKWSTARGVSFVSVKTNKTCYIAVCANINTCIMCAEWYIVESYSKSYVGLFHLVLDSWYWTEYDGHVDLPPEARRQAGRPPSIRMYTTMDEGREGHMCYRCQICKQLGHNKRRRPNTNAPSCSAG